MWSFLNALIFYLITFSSLQDHQGISNVAPADAPLRSLTIPKVEISPETETNILSEARIHDYISNLTFSISPTAFFQVRSSGRRFSCLTVFFIFYFIFFFSEY